MKDNEICELRQERDALAAALRYAEEQWMGHPLDIPMLDCTAILSTHDAEVRKPLEAEITRLRALCGELAGELFGTERHIIKLKAVLAKLIVVADLRGILHSHILKMIDDYGHPGCRMRGTPRGGAETMKPDRIREPHNASDRVYTCSEPGCETLRSQDEGGTTFTVCDKHWRRYTVSGPQIKTGSDADTAIPRGPEKKEKVCG